MEPTALDSLRSGLGGADQNPFNGSAFPLRFQRFFEEETGFYKAYDLNSANARACFWFTEQFSGKSISKIIFGVGSNGGTLNNVSLGLDLYAADERGRKTGVALASETIAAGAGVFTQWTPKVTALTSAYGTTQGNRYVVVIRPTNAAPSTDFLRIPRNVGPNPHGGCGFLWSSDALSTYDTICGYEPALGIVYSDGSYWGPPMIGPGNGGGARGLTSQTFRSDDGNTRWMGAEWLLEEDKFLRACHITPAHSGTPTTSMKVVVDAYIRASRSAEPIYIGTTIDEFTKGAGTTLNDAYFLRFAAAGSQGLRCYGNQYLMLLARANDTIQTNVNHFKLAGWTPFPDGVNQGGTLLWDYRAVQATKAGAPGTVHPAQADITFPTDAAGWLEACFD